MQPAPAPSYTSAEPESESTGPGSEPKITITGAEWVDVDDIEDPDKTPVMPIEYETERETLSKVKINA